MKIPLTFLSLSALAVAQTIQICNEFSIYCIRMDTVVPQSGDPAVWFPPSMYYAQRWIWTDEGYLINAYSGLALEAPLNSKGNLIKGRGLVLKEQVPGALNQQWKIALNARNEQRIVSKKNESMSIAGKDGIIDQAYHPLAVYPVNDTDPNQVFKYYSVMQRLYGTSGYYKCANVDGAPRSGLCSHQ